MKPYHHHTRTHVGRRGSEITQQQDPPVLPVQKLSGTVAVEVEVLRDEVLGEDIVGDHRDDGRGTMRLGAPQAAIHSHYGPHWGFVSVHGTHKKK